MAKGQVRDAERVAHTLRGVSGNIGAPQIQALAARVEKACASGREVAEVEALCHDLAIPLKALVSAMERELGPEARAAEPQVVASDPQPEILNEMHHLLLNFDPAASDFLEAHRSALAAALPALAFAEFERHIQNYAFDEALRLLDGSQRE
jgi:HPt (histidine-containing phosphotransfer) domain-containing protein